MKRIIFTLTAVVFVFAISACDPRRKVRQRPVQGPETTEPINPRGPTLSPDENPGSGSRETTERPDPGPKVNPVPVPEPQAAPKSPEYAIKIDGKPGYVKSPYDAAARMIDVRGLPPGTEAECPYTHRTFLVPP